MYSGDLYAEPSDPERSAVLQWQTARRVRRYSPGWATAFQISLIIMFVLRGQETVQMQIFPRCEAAVSAGEQPSGRYYRESDDCVLSLIVIFPPSSPPKKRPRSNHTGAVGLLKYHNAKWGVSAESSVCCLPSSVPLTFSSRVWSLEGCVGS